MQLSNLRAGYREIGVLFPTNSSGAAESNPKRRVLKAFAASSSGNVASLILQLLSVPVFLKFWGVQTYGEWILIFVIPGYFALSDFGVLAVSNNKIDYFVSKRKYLSANVVYVNSVLVIASILSIFSLATVGLSFVLKSQIENVFQTISGFDLFGTIIFLVLDTGILLFVNHHALLLRSVHRFDLAINLQTINRTISVLVPMLIAMLGGQIFWAVVAMLLTRLALCVWIGSLLINRVRWLSRRLMIFSSPCIKDLLRIGSHYMAMPLANVFYLNVTTVLVGAVANAAAVAAFNTVRTFTRLIPQFVSSVGRAYWSELSRFGPVANANYYKIRKSILVKTTAISLIFLVAYSIFGELIFKYWTSNRLDFDRFLFIAFLINAVVIALYTSIEVLLLARNRHSEYSLIFCGATLLQVAAGYLAQKKIGLMAYPLFGAAFSAFIVLYLLKKTAKGDH